MEEEKKPIKTDSNLDGVDTKVEIAEPKGKQNFFSRVKNKFKAKQLERIKKEELSEEEKKKVEEKLEEATKEVNDKSKAKRKKILNILYFIFNIALVVGILIWNILTTEDFTPLQLADINFFYIFVMLLMLVGMIVVDVFAIHRMIYRKTLRSRWVLSYKSLGILRYYDAIIPMSGGGQAFMATYLNARDVPASTSLSIPMAKLVFQQTAWLIVTFVCLVLSFVSGSSQTFVSVASIIGFILAFIAVAFIVFISLSRKLGEKLVSWGLKLLVKLRIIKSYDKQYEKVMNFVSDYQNIIKEYSRAKWDILYQLALHVIRFIFLFSIPYFVYLAFPFQGGKIGSYGEFFIYTALIDLAASFIPLPGGTGMNEITFAALFNDYLGGYTFWALILWRFCSYYIDLLQGLGVMIYDTVYGNRKYRWVKTKLALQEESQEFRKTQIESFRQERNKRRNKVKKI